MLNRTKRYEKEAKEQAQIEEKDVQDTLILRLRE